jgi:hypothetical protein
MLLASNKQQHEETTKKQKDTTGKTKHKEKTAGKNKTKWAYNKLPTYKTIYRIIWKTSNAEFQKGIFLY